MATQVAARAARKQSNAYIWKGLQRGKPTEGEIYADNIAMVRQKLQKRSIVVKSIRKKSQPLINFGNSVNPADVAMFTRQMSTMFKCGIPLVQGLELVVNSSEKQAVKDLISRLQGEVSSGTSFSEALRNNPKTFDALYISLIAAGEQSGTLETMLERVALYKEKTESMKKRIKSALRYPLAVLGIALIVTVVLLIKVVPTFATTFASFGAELPKFTQLILDLSNYMQANWYVMAGGAVGAFLLFKQAMKNQGFADKMDGVMLKLPIVGSILEESIIANFSRTLSIIFAAGVPLVDGLASVAAAANNAVYRDAILKMRENVTSGTALNITMQESRKFPALAVQMANIGEESGSLDTMLARVADHFEESVDDKVDNLSSLMEPLIMVVLGVLVGGLLIAMYMPIFSMGAVVQ